MRPDGAPLLQCVRSGFLHHAQLSAPKTLRGLPSEKAWKGRRHRNRSMSAGRLCLERTDKRTPHAQPLTVADFAAQ